jgi:hypothetical protein
LAFLCKIKCNFSSSVLQEKSFKSGSDIHNFLPWWGLVGFIITAVESYFFGEIDKVVSRYTLDYEIILLFLGFVATLAIITSITPFFIKRSSTSMFNIAIVSKIFWSYLVEVISDEVYPRNFFYYIGFGIIVVGVFLFNIYPAKGKTYGHDINKPFLDNRSEISSSSAFSSDRKYTYIKNNTLQVTANKYLNNA